MDVHSQLATGPGLGFVENRHSPRFKIEVPICVYPRNCAVVRGTTVDLSETGISAILRQEVPIGEVVRLEFVLPCGAVEIHAMVRQRSAFRYGFQFIEASSSHDIVGQTCRELAIGRSVVDQE